MFPGEVLNLGLYLVQQLGVMLGVGAATITLIAHLVANRDGVVEPHEARFARVIDRVLMVGLLCIICSGVVITAFHSLSGEAGVIFTPAYLFKWLLVTILAVPLIIGHKHPFPPVVFAGFVGATWYAMFLLHVIAPITSWGDLFLIYAVWVAAFLVLWAMLARLFHIPVFTFAKHFTLSLPKPTLASVPAVVKPALPPAVKPAPKAIAVAVITSTPKPVAPLPVVKVSPPPLKPIVIAAPAPHKPVAAPAPHKPAELPPPHAALPPPFPMPQKPALSVPEKLPIKQEELVLDPDQFPGLPAIRVMPRTQEDVDKQLRATVVQFF